MTNPAGVFPSGTPNQQVTGNLTVPDPTGVAAGSTLTINTDGLGSLGIRISGTPTGATVLFEGSVDGVIWDNPKAYPLTVGAAGVQSTSAAGDFEVNCAGFKQFRLCLSALTTGSFAALINGTAALKHVGVKNGNPADLQATTVPTVGGNALSNANPLPVGQIIGGAPISVGNPMPIFDGYSAPVASTWTTATGANTAQTVSTAGMDTVIVTVIANAALTGGGTIFEVFDGLTWLPIKAPTIVDYTTVGTIALVSNYSKGFQVPVAGFPQFRVRLSSVLTGAGASLLVTSIVSSAPDVSLVTVGLDPSQPLPAGANIIGTVVDVAAQFTPTDRSGIVSGAVASATIAAGGSGGTTGTQTVTGTTGTGTKFQASVTVASGAITAVLSITVPGVYTASPTNIAAEPVTGGGLTGATLNLTMIGVATQIAAANAARRKFEFQPTSVTALDWALNKSGNAVTPALGAKGSLQIARMQSTTVGGMIYSDSSSAVIMVYNAVAFAAFTASES